MTKNYDPVIKKHYANVAKQFGVSDQSTMQDPIIREAEKKFVQEYLKGPQSLRVLDMGCGNGSLLAYLSTSFPQHDYLGLELNQDLLDLAQTRKLSSTKFEEGDIRQESVLQHGLFDVIITKRVIINILDRKDQLTSFAHLTKLLRPGGRYLMIESFREPLEKLNRARKEMRLDPVSESYQNKYLTELSVDKLCQTGVVEESSLVPQNYLSTHFYITRVLHKVIRPSGGKLKFTEFDDFFNQALPPAVGNFSPILFRVFRKGPLVS